MLLRKNRDTFLMIRIDDPGCSFLLSCVVRRFECLSFHNLFRSPLWGGVWDWFLGVWGRVTGYRKRLDRQNAGNDCGSVRSGLVFRCDVQRSVVIPLPIELITIYPVRSSSGWIFKSAHNFQEVKRSSVFWIWVQTVMESVQACRGIN